MSSRRWAAADVRRGERWTGPQRAKNAILYQIVRSALWLADRLPPRLVLAAGRVLGRMAHALLPALRNVARANVAGGLPGKDAEGLTLRAFVNAGENLCRCLLLRRTSTRALDHVVVPDASIAVFQRALALQRGVVFVSAHLGPFELVPAAIAELGIMSSIVVRESYDPRLDPLVDAHRYQRGLDVIHRGAPSAPTRILRALRSGRPVGFLPDLGGRVPSTRTELLRQSCELPVGPQRIALRAGCPLLVGTLVERAEGGEPFCLHIEEVRTDGSEESVTHRVAAALTRAIEATPEHWLWMARRLG